MILRRLFGDTAKKGTTGGEVAPDEARKRQEEGAILIDVREPDEWRAGHAPDARHIPLGRLSGHIAKLPKDRQLLFICQSGSRSRAATSLARRAGLEQVLNVRGGMLAWVRAGLPVSR